MPAKNRRKEYIKGGIYHIYNRGIDGREIFKEDKDYLYLEKVIGRYITGEEVTNKGYKTDRPSVSRRKKKSYLVGEVEILTYCLMPDHFHLLVRQNSPEGITRLMRRVFTNYVMYFNQKYHRRGTLFENIYRAAIITDAEQVVQVSKYIHLNPVNRQVRRFGPVETVTGSRLEDYLYSSFSSYIGTNIKDWVNIVYIKTQARDYQKFVYAKLSEAEKNLGNLLLE